VLKGLSLNDFRRPVLSTHTLVQSALLPLHAACLYPACNRREDFGGALFFQPAYFANVVRFKLLRQPFEDGRPIDSGLGSAYSARSRRAAALGYQLALVKTPYYYKPMMTPAVLEEHFLRVADASPIPILIYSVPFFTGITVEAALAARLARHPNIAGIKDSAGSPARSGEIVRQSPQDFQVLVGSAQNFADSLAAGARGGVLALACVLPELCVELYEAHMRRDPARVQELQRLIVDPAINIVGKYGPAGVKYAMDQRGFYGGPPRPPLQAPSGESAFEVERILQAALKAEGAALGSPARA